MIKIITPLTQLDAATPQFTVGTRTTTKDGNEYIYLPGVASCAQYDWVRYVTASGVSYGSVTRFTAANIGPIAVAQAAVTATNYGWFQTKGVGWANAGGDITSGSQLYSSGTTATVDDASAGSIIRGAIAVGTGVAGGTVLTFLNYPQVSATN